MTKGGNRSSIMCKNKLKHRSLVFLGRKKPRNIRTQWIYAQAGRIVKLGATPEVDEKVIRRKSKTDGKKQFCQSQKSTMTTLIKLSNQTLRFLHSSYDVSLTRQIISFRKFSIAMAPLLRQPSLIPYKRNIPGWSAPMKLYVLSGPKETKRICLMLDPERFRILSHDQAYAWCMRRRWMDAGHEDRWVKGIKRWIFSQLVWTGTF